MTLVDISLSIFSACYLLGAVYTTVLAWRAKSWHAMRWTWLALATFCYVAGFFIFVYPSGFDLIRVLELHMILSFLILILHIHCLKHYLQFKPGHLFIPINILILITALYSVYVLLGVVSGSSFLIEERPYSVDYQLIANRVSDRYDVNLISGTSHLLSRVVALYVFIQILTREWHRLSTVLRYGTLLNIALLIHNVISMHVHIEIYVPALIVFNVVLLGLYCFESKGQARDTHPPITH